MPRDGAHWLLLSLLPLLLLLCSDCRFDEKDAEGWGEGARTAGDRVVLVALCDKLPAPRLGLSLSRGRALPCLAYRCFVRCCRLLLFFNKLVILLNYSSSRQSLSGRHPLPLPQSPLAPHVTEPHSTCALSDYIGLSRQRRRRRCRDVAFALACLGVDLLPPPPPSPTMPPIPSLS